MERFDRAVRNLVGGLIALGGYREGSFQKHVSLMPIDVVAHLHHIRIRIERDALGELRSLPVTLDFHGCAKRCSWLDRADGVDAVDRGVVIEGAGDRCSRRRIPSGSSLKVCSWLAQALGAMSLRAGLDIDEAGDAAVRLVDGDADDAVFEGDGCRICRLGFDELLFIVVRRVMDPGRGGVCNQARADRRRGRGRVKVLVAASWLSTCVATGLLLSSSRRMPSALLGELHGELARFQSAARRAG